MRENIPKSSSRLSESLRIDPSVDACDFILFFHFIRLATKKNLFSITDQFSQSVCSSIRAALPSSEIAVSEINFRYELLGSLEESASVF